MGIYIYLLLNGLEFQQIADLMTSDIVEKIKTEVNVNRMYDEYETVQTIIDLLLDGDYLIKYIDDIYIDPVIELINKITGKSYNKYNVGEALTIAEITDLLDKLETDSFKLYSDFDQGYGSNKNLKGLYKYLNRIKIRKELLSMSKTSLNTFVKAFYGAQEVKVLGQILGINGGVKTKTNERYNFSKAFQKLYIDTIHTQGKDSNHSDVFGSNLQSFEFDLDRFLTDSDYAEKICSIYGKAKYVVNVFDLIRKLPHVKSFLKAYLTNESISKASSVKYNLMYKIASELEPDLTFRNVNVHTNRIQSKFGSPGTKLRVVDKLTDTQLTSIRNYVDELLVQNYFNSTNLTVTIPVGLGVYNNGVLIPNSQAEEVNLKTNDGIATFKHYMDKYVIPKLKMGNIINANGVEVFNQDILNNEFLSRLIQSFKNHPLNESIYSYWRIPKSLVTLDDIESNKQIIALDNISDVTFEGNKLHDLFFIYDLIINKGKASSGSFISLLQQCSISQNSELIKFFKFVGNMDYNQDIITKNVNLQYVKLLLASKKGSYEANKVSNGYIKRYNNTILKWEVVNKLTGETVEFPNDISDYLFLNELIGKKLRDTNKIPEGFVSETVNHLYKLMTNNKLKILFDCE